MSPAARIARKEAGELLLSQRGLGFLLAVTAAQSVFALLLVGSTELSLLDNAQVVYDMLGIVTALGALLALVVGLDTVAGERARGSLVPLLLTPVSRDSILAAKIAAVAIAWGVLYALSLPYVWAVGSTGQNMLPGMAVLAVFGSAVVLGFGFFGMGLGARLKSGMAGLLGALTALIVSASPLLLGPSLRQSAIGRGFDAVNPFSAAVNTYDAVIIDSQAITAQWPHIALAAAWLALSLWFARSGFRRVAR